MVTCVAVLCEAYRPSFVSAIKRIIDPAVRISLSCRFGAGGVWRNETVCHMRFIFLLCVFPHYKT
jgi:hypothetical protein